MTDDATLLHRYAAAHDEAAFAEFVQRRIGLVYSTALRQLAGDDHLARDATQLVFIDAARKARALARHPLLTGWLYTATHHATAKLVRGEQRRRFHENKASTMNAAQTDNADAPSWESMRPLLDAALRELGEVDRAAILLRFFENQPFSVVGQHLRLSEDAARKRVDRALEKLHVTLARRGVASTSAALAAVLSTQAVHAAPAGLAQVVAGLAVKSAASATVAAGTLAVLAGSKFQLGVAVVLVAVVGAGAVREQATVSTLRAQIAQATQVNHQARAAQVATRVRFDALRAASARGQDARGPDIDIPSTEERLLNASRTTFPVIWAALIRRLQLQPDTVTAFVELDIERRRAGDAAMALARREGLSEAALAAHHTILARTVEAGFAERFHALLGKDTYTLLREYQRTLTARNELGGFSRAAANANVPVSDRQMDALATVFTDAGLRGTRPVADRPLPSSPEVLEQTRAILTPAQFEKLMAFQSARLALQEIDRHNRAAAARGALRLNRATSPYYPAAPDPAANASPVH